MARGEDRGASRLSDSYLLLRSLFQEANSFQLDADEAYFKEHNEPLFSSHMIDLSAEDVEWNIDTTAKYLERVAPMKQWLEMEIGITGGEEDGVNNGELCNCLPVGCRRTILLPSVARTVE